MSEATYITSIIDNARYCKSNGQFTKHLRNNNISYQQYYEKYITGIEEQCLHCNSPKTFYQKDHTYGKTCGSTACVGKEVHTTKSQWSKEQQENDRTNKKFAASQRTVDEYNEIIRKRKDTNLVKFGVVHSTQSANNKNKSRATKLRKYGNEYYAGWEKSAEKNRNKTIEEQNEINQIRRLTNIEKFGVGCTFLTPETIKKSRQSNAIGKDYTLPSGKIVHIRGYENKVLDALFDQGYTETDLIMHNSLEKYELPIFEYVNVNEHNTQYYPDIFIPTENRIIEVKAQYWWDGNGDLKHIYKSRLINNLKKKDAVLSKGYKYEVWLFKTSAEYEILRYDL
jgi:hypothetical protein